MSESKDNTIKLKRVKGSVIYDAEKDQIDFEGKKFTGNFLRLISETNTKPIEFKPIRTELSAKETAAIHLRVPDSGTNWLDAMIQKARRYEFIKVVAPIYFNDKHDKAEGFLTFCTMIANALIKAADEGIWE